MQQRHRWLVKGCLLGCAIALLLASVPTAMDWYTNPAGLFRGASGTRWDIVLDTFLSWLWPLILVCAPLSVAVLHGSNSRRFARSMDP